MTPTATDRPPEIGNGPAEQPAKQPRQRKPAPAPTTQAEPAKRRKARTVNLDRAYYVCEIMMDGEIDRLIAKFPTIGQARKGFELVCSASRTDKAMARIARVVLVD